MKGRNHCPLCGGSRFRELYRDWQDNPFQVCAACGLVFQNPYRSRVDYGDDYWKTVTDPDGVHRNLLEEREFRVRNWYGKIPSYINSLPPGKILDIGCGPGHLLSALADHHEKHGLELSAPCIDHIRQNYPDIHLTEGTLENYPNSTGKFDTIIFFHVIEHLEDPLPALEKIHALLNATGVLIIGTPNIGSFCAARFQGNFRLLGAPHLTLFNEKTLEEMLVKAGFTVTAKEFPFFRTDYFTLRNLLRLWNTRKLSPPFYKNVMTFYAGKRESVP